jgi:ABC-type nitrate/sulfonate/bicarbonate transport system substrate-binding protein
MDRLRLNTFSRQASHDVAVARGLYADENLEVEHTSTTGSKVQMQELKDGVWDVVGTHADNVFWWNEDNGADFLIVQALPTTPNLILVVAPEITSYEDLRGRTIAADASESGFVTSLRVMLQEHGLAEEGRDFFFEEIGTDRVAALREGRFAGSMLNTGAERRLEDIGYHVLDSIDHLYASYATPQAFRGAWVNEHAEIVVRYLRAQMRALLWLENPDNAVEAAPYRSGRPTGTPLTAPPPFCWDGLRDMMAVRQRAGLLRGAVDPHRFADDRYYAEATRGLG